MSKSSTITKPLPYSAKLVRPAGGWKMQRVTTHPGEVLREDFMKPLKISANALARRLGIPPSRLHGILHEKRAITPDTAMRLARLFNMSTVFWMNLQSEHDLTKAQMQSGDQIAREVKPMEQSNMAEAA